jgi:hypothetical protein
MVTPNRPLTSITYPGKSGVAHEWAYLPDAGEVFAELMATNCGGSGWRPFRNWR